MTKDGMVLLKEMVWPLYFCCSFAANPTPNCLSHCSSCDCAGRHDRRWNDVQRASHWRASQAGRAVHNRGAFYCRNNSRQGLHPRLIVDGFDIAKKEALRVLDELKITRAMDRDTLISVARTSLRTKVYAALADILTEVGFYLSCS